MHDRILVGKECYKLISVRPQIRVFFFLAIGQVCRDREIFDVTKFLGRTHSPLSRTPPGLSCAPSLVCRAREAFSVVTHTMPHCCSRLRPVVHDKVSLSCTRPALLLRDTVPHYHDIEHYVVTWKPHVLELSVTT